MSLFTTCNLGAREGCHLLIMSQLCPSWPFEVTCCPLPCYIWVFVQCLNRETHNVLCHLFSNTIPAVAMAFYCLGVVLIKQYLKVIIDWQLAILCTQYIFEHRETSDSFYYIKLSYICVHCRVNHWCFYSFVQYSFWSQCLITADRWISRTLIPANLVDSMVKQSFCLL